jgi:conjugal transfer mating pair stabilization protein TraG
VGTIYCYGNGEILWKVFNGIALIFGGASFMQSMMAITSVVGILWATTRIVFGENLGIFSRTWLIPTFVIFNLFFLPKTTVHIVDKVDPSFRYSAVDNVPYGVVFFPALASLLSYVVTDKVSQYMSPANDNSFAHTGDLFAAKFVSLAKDIRISSPRHRSNMKHFANRCFLWPYVYANTQGLQDAAQKTNDILGFIRAHPHRWCGSYWENDQGENVFLTCAQGAQEAQRILEAELPLTGRLLTSRIFNTGVPREEEGLQVQQKLKRLIPNAWEQITGQSQNAFKVIDQFVMINAYREGRDDDREASGLGRLFPELVSLQASRAQAQQTTSGLIKGEMAGSYIPMMHGALFSLLVLLFVFIVPMTFMPGGISIFTTWVRLIFWIGLWPPFFAMFEALASMALIKSSLSETALSGGLSLATHTGLSDLAVDMYSYFKSSLLLVPVVSWFVVSGSSYAITQFAGGLTAAMGAGADKGASEAVDGNLSFDNQNLSNRTMGSMSVGQQTLGPSLSFGSRVDTGSMSMTTDPSTGHVHSETHMTQLASNVTSTDNFAASLNRERTDAQSATQESQVRFESAKSAHDQTSLSLANSYASGDFHVKGLTQQQNIDAQKLFEEARQTSATMSSESATEDRNSSSNNLEGHVGVNAGGLLGAAVGLNAGASASSSMESSASASAQTRIAEENNWNESQKNLFTFATQQMQSGNIEARDEKSENLAREQRSHYEETTQAAENYSASSTYSKNLAKVQSLQDRGEISVTRNLTDEAIKSLADTRFGGNESAAHQWASKNDSEWAVYASRYGQEKMGTLFHSLKGQDLSDNQIKNHFNQSADFVRSKAPISHTQEEMQHKYDEKSQSVSHTLASERSRFESDYEKNKKNVYDAGERVTKKSR